MNKWRWDVGFNIGFNQNRVTKTPNHVPIQQTVVDVTQQIKEGQDIYSWYMKEWAGVDKETGDPLWYVVNEDGNYVLDASGNKTTTSDYNATHARVVGTASPMFSGGINTQLSWNGIFLHVNTNFTYGNQIYNATRQVTDADGAYTASAFLVMDLQGDSHSLPIGEFPDCGKNLVCDGVCALGNGRVHVASKGPADDLGVVIY